MAAEAVATAAAGVVAINAEKPENQREFDLPQHRYLDSFQYSPASIWNCLKMRLFLLHLEAVFHIDEGASPRVLLVS
jgi:hypothetical protein